MRKKRTFNGKFKYLILLASFVCNVNLLLAQTEKTRTIEKTFEGKTAVWASHRFGDLVLKKGSGSQIKAILTISAESKKAEELQQFLDRFDMQTSEAPDNKIDIKTSDIICKWNVVNGRSTIKFNDGQSFSGIHKFKMTLEIYVPMLRYATLENKYAAIKVEDGTAETLELNLFDGQVEAPGNYTNLNLDMKYSKGTIGNFSNCNAQFYDSDLSMGNGGNLTLASKYSGVKLGNQQMLQLDCFDDNYKIGSVSGITTITDKYSEFDFSGDIGNAVLMLYDSKVNAKNAANVQISDSKYTEFAFQEVNSLQFNASFDDAVHLTKVGSLSALDSKYTEYVVGGIWKSINFPASYDDAITVGNVGSTFDGLNFDGKYTELSIPIPGTLKYEIDAYLKYGKLIYPESDMEMTVLKEKNDEITLQAKIKGASAAAPKFHIRSFDGVIKLK